MPLGSVLFLSPELFGPPIANLFVEVEVDNIDPPLTDRRFEGSFTIAEWCKHRRVSIAMYYKLRAQGKAPATLPLGRHQTITAELTPLGHASARPKRISK